MAVARLGTGRACAKFWTANVKLLCTKGYALRRISEEKRSISTKVKLLRHLRPLDSRPNRVSYVQICILPNNTLHDRNRDEMERVGEKDSNRGLTKLKLCFAKREVIEPLLLNDDQAVRNRCTDGSL